MISAIEELKIQAKKLLKSQNPPEKLIKLSQLTSSDQTLKLKHCQQYIAQKYGFRHWQACTSALTYENDSFSNYDGFWYSHKCGTLLNHWCANHEEAKQVQQDIGGTILPYKSQFVVASGEYLNFVGLTQNDELLSAINHDFLQANSEFRQKLLLKRVLVK